MSTQPRRFELFLASLMTEPETEGEISRRVGVSHEALRTIRAEEEAAGFWTHSLSYFEQRLPRAGLDTAFSVHVPCEPGTRRHRFALELWPNFELGILTGPDDVPFYPHFVRRSGTEPAIANALLAIQPWSATLEEIVARFGAPLDHSGWDLRRWLTYRAGAERWIVTFDLALVQSVHSEP